VQQRAAASEAQDAQRKQEEIQGKVMERQAQKAIIQQLRQERIQRGAVESRAANVGGGTAPMATIGGLSSVQGGLGALGMQTAQNMQEVRFGASSARALGAAQGDIMNAQSSQQGWADLGKLSQNIWSNSDRISSGLKNIFA
jgi:hypothetical protein